MDTEETPSMALGRVCAEPDPAVRGRMATELMALYRDHILKLAPLRREAALELHHDQGKSYDAIADDFGVSTGRIMQIFENRAR